jgi:hypothetical protein
MTPEISRLNTHGLLSVGIVKDLKYVSSLPLDINDLMIRIRESVQSVDRDAMNNTWDEILDRVDVIRVTNVAHIEHL